MRGTESVVHVAPARSRCIPAHAGNGVEWSEAQSAWSVHPRACGERGCTAATRRATGGASPRMRGTVVSRECHAQRCRCIPAHAGNGQSKCSKSWSTAVHPRACGERGLLREVAPLCTGASPRMRGTARRHGTLDPLNRCIPAHAGNGFAQPVEVALAPVHPRACGERPLVQVQVGAAGGASPRMRGTACGRGRGSPGRRCIPAHAGNGSPSAPPPRCSAGASPRMRGTVPHPWRHAGRVRCIPAHAGNGESTRRRPACRAVHPRACGERSSEHALSKARSGASPRMRGTVAGALHRGRADRCIPAHAGNGSPRRRRPRCSAVHPRACGERHRSYGYTDADYGASPRMRGTEARGSGGTVCGRCIPAHAGNGERCARSARGVAVHPRACGERTSSQRSRRFRFGASPRMRGTAGRPRAGWHRRRCIPAHAGNGWPWASRPARTPVHPRACGERGEWIPDNPGVAGASPRMRGTARTRRRRGRPSRCIPAHAGNGSVLCCAPLIGAVHPRACGERLQAMNSSR